MRTDRRRLFLTELNFTLQIVEGFLEILNRIRVILVPRATDILDHIAEGEIEPLILDKREDFDLPTKVVMRLYDGIVRHDPRSGGFRVL